MARKIPKAPSLKRTVQVADPKVEIYIVCEGKNTEPAYFESCADHYGNGLVSVLPIGGAGVPLTIIQTAKDLRERLLEERRKRKIKNSFDACFRVWAVFDRDEHPEVERALALAVESKIEVGFSNPCFEVWPLLHLIDYGAQDGRHAVQRTLSAHMPSYDHERTAIVDFEQIKENFQLAFNRAEVLQTARIAENCINGCPTTNVGKLVEKIIQNGKKWSFAVKK